VCRAASRQLHMQGKKGRETRHTRVRSSRQRQSSRQAGCRSSNGSAGNKPGRQGMQAVAARNRKQNRQAGRRGNKPSLTHLVARNNKQYTATTGCKVQCLKAQTWFCNNRTSACAADHAVQMPIDAYANHARSWQYMQTCPASCNTQPEQPNRRCHDASTSTVVQSRCASKRQQYGTVQQTKQAAAVQRHLQAGSQA
jgi:hypothetical protein